MFVRTLLLLTAAAALAAAGEVNFGKDKPGAVPKGWQVAMTHEGGAPRWEVALDPTAPLSPPRVLAQTSRDNTNGRYPLAIYRKARFADGSVAVRFKPVSGAVDQAAGIVWRYRDPNHYYIVRANALEDNVVLYKVEGGKRVALAPTGSPPKTYGVSHKVPKAAWGELRVDFRGPVFEVFHDGEKIMQVEDATFTGAGLVGLWTKADSVTHFDDFRFVRRR